ncbi:MAG: hypothetical protein JWR14_5622 [Caballeronia sp.]|jgi:hypothetical protein|nr:hypothetical protein [Caballeronia sp.]
MALQSPGLDKFPRLAAEARLHSLLIALCSLGDSLAPGKRTLGVTSVAVFRFWQAAPKVTNFGSRAVADTSDGSPKQVNLTTGDQAIAFSSDLCHAAIDTQLCTSYVAAVCGREE